MIRAPLPVDEVLSELLAAARAARSVVLIAPPGAGKTTRVPPALLDAGLGAVWVLEPRRLAARAAARRSAEERGAALGEEVGYHVRFDRRAGPRTRLLVVTEGILLQRLQDDPFLDGVGALVFDEVHERGLDADLALAMARRVQREARGDLVLVAMSATLESERFAAFLDAPLVRSEGRLFPVERRHSPSRGREPLAEQMARGIALALDQSPGDVLAFLPGAGEIRRARAELERTGIAARAELHELFGDLSPERQDAALRAGARRRIVLATNVAETSVTVEGVTAVVDSGLARVPRFDPALGLDRLELRRISRASAEQRAGRAGRLAPGLALRLWSEMEERALPEREEPEVRRVDLAGAVLQLAAWGESDARAFPWMEAPRGEHVARAEDFLRGIGALGRGGITPLGRALARLPLHPRLGRLLIEGARLGVPERAALAAALLSERDPLRAREAPRDASDSDVLARVRALEDFERGAAVPELAGGAARAILRARDQLLRRGRLDEGPRPRGAREADEALLRALFAAWADRLARRRVPGEPSALLAGGRGVRLSPQSAVTEAELFVCVELDAAPGEAVVHLASAVEREWLDPERFEERREARFDPARGRAVLARRLEWGGLVLEERVAPLDDPVEAERLLAEAALADPARSLGLERPELAALLARLAFLREHMPELELPAFDEAHWRELVPLLVPGRRSLDELARAPLAELVRGSSSRRQLEALEREAPERLEVPSGSRLRIEYPPGRPPFLAARIQELFGLAETPRLAAGRVPLVLHLLAPSGRPQQVTDDLASFWSGAYHLVRKELRARYPRHSWPEDPWSAKAERRPHRRRGRG